MLDKDRTKSQLLNAWHAIFLLGDQSDLDKPLSLSELNNPNNEIVKTLIRIYSMESFLVYELNRASRE